MILLSTRAKIFALYLGQKMDSSLKGTVINGSWIQRLQDGELDATIMLKPLYKITKKQAIKVAMALYNWPDNAPPLTKITINSKFYNKSFCDILSLQFIDPEDNHWTLRFRDNDISAYKNDYWLRLEALANYSHVIDYLRDRGFAMPAYGHTVDELVKEGIFSLD